MGGTSLRSPVDAPVAAVVRKSYEHEPELTLFNAVFGRDSLICGLILAPWYPAVLWSAVAVLARHQGTTCVERREEEPGRIAHEIRDAERDPVARRITENAGWAWPYYGSIDATPLFVLAVRSLVRILGPEVLDRPVQGGATSVRAAVVGALAWLLGRLEGEAVPLLVSRRAFEGSIENQVWRDSFDAYHHADGALATVDTVASVEAQAIAHAALLAGAELLRSSPSRGIDLGRSPDELADLAQTLATIVADNFLVSDDLGDFVALGVDRGPDGSLRPLRVRTSNPGWTLLSSIWNSSGDPEECRGLVARSLLVDGMATPAGIRTLHPSSPRFRPTGYHNGNVWPFDTYIVAQGLAAAGETGAATQLCDGIVRACTNVGLFPEFFIGTDVGVEVADVIVEVGQPDGRVNRICQAPQPHQSWTAAAVLAAKHGR
jgi:glycogen debranching enzyme